MNINSHLLGDILIHMEIVSKAKVAEALHFQKGFMADLLIESDFDPSELISKHRTEKNKEIPMLGQILIQRGLLKEEQLAPALDIQNQQTLDLCLLSREKLANAIKVGLVISSSIDIVDVLSLIMKYANIVTNAESSTLMLLDEKTGELVFSVPTGPGNEELTDIRIPPGAGVAGWVAENQQSLIVSDTKKDPRFYSNIDDISGIETKTLLCVPMRSNRRLIGVLEVINKKNDECFDEEDALLLSIVSNHSAIAIENAMLLRATKNRIEKEKSIVKKVAESERIQSLGTLAGGIAHDFNNILGGIVGYAELCQMDTPKDSKQFSYLKKVLVATDRAKNLIKQILTYSRQSENEFKPVQVNIIATEALKLLRASLPKYIDIIEDLKCHSKVLGDSTQIHQVVMNLCTNASHAIKSTGGSLKVSLSDVKVELSSNEFDHNLVPGPYLKLSVEDTGEGMAPHILEHIFEPFFTTKEQDQGTGMGLAVVHGIIKTHGGEIKVKTKPGKGTVFDIFLPIIKKTIEASKRD